MKINKHVFIIACINNVIRISSFVIKDFSMIIVLDEEKELKSILY